MILDLVSFHRALGSSLATFTRGEKGEKSMSEGMIAVIASWGDILQICGYLAIKKARTLSYGAREVPEGSQRVKTRGVWIDFGSRVLALLSLRTETDTGPITDMVVTKEYYRQLISKELLSDLDGRYDGAVFQHEKFVKAMCTVVDALFRKLL
jgi:hypothetical protein